MNWNLDLVATVISVIFGVLSSVQILKEFLTTDNVTIQQNNNKGDNIYIDKRTTTTINKFQPSSSKKKVTKRSSNNEIDDPFLYAVLGFCALIFSLALYSQTYKILPLFCIILFTIHVWKEIAVPFESLSAKIFWFIKKLLIFALIISLFSMPRSIIKVVDLTPPISISSWSSFRDWWSTIIEIVFSLWNDNRLILFSLFAKIFGTLSLLLFLFSLCRKNISIHKKPLFATVLSFVEFLIFFLIILNVEICWAIIEPFINAILKWTST